MGRTFGSVLVANRGEIAVRVIRACREAGLRSIAIYSDADATALHVRQADAAHRVGPPPPSESYLNAAAILDAARKSGAQAVHPGYGFLAESADFAEQCEQAGLIWIGPSPAAMRQLGDKAAARALAARLGVPTLPGFHDDAQDDPTLHSAAEALGYPLLVKAAAGGGGRGMRLVETGQDLPEALAAARREARSAFGDDRLLLERYLRRPRHVEMQVFGDEHGNVLYLGERDCSIQRRYQKVVEEAPGPHFSGEQRRAMGEAAVALARAAAYTNAGTVEFLLDEDGRFYFLEVNTRLQVEHPVTEMVTGLDLVRLQFKVAAGDPLPLRQEDLKIDGHAIECRLYAEDPSTGFLPSTGRLDALLLPQADAARLRVDLGYVSGDAITSWYDPLLAKIVTHGQDRGNAADLMAAALGEIEVSGLQTNLDFLQAVVAAPAFERGAVHTHFVHEHGLDRGPLQPRDNLLIAAAVMEIADARCGTGEPVDPWRSCGPWRNGWVNAEVFYRFAGHLLRARFRPPIIDGGPWWFDLPGGETERKVSYAPGPAVVLEADGDRSEILVVRGGSDPDSRLVKQGRDTARLRLVSALDLDSGHRPTDALSHHDVIRSPMPGRVARILVKPGERVKAHQTLLVLEAMKIEHLVTAPCDGVVEAVRYNEGDQVEVGAELVELED